MAYLLRSSSASAHHTPEYGTQLHRDLEKLQKEKLTGRQNHATSSVEYSPVHVCCMNLVPFNQANQVCLVLFPTHSLAYYTGGLVSVVLDARCVQLCMHICHQCSLGSEY